MACRHTWVSCRHARFSEVFGSKKILVFTQAFRTQPYSPSHSLQQRWTSPGLTRVPHSNDPGVLLAESLDQQHPDGIQILCLVDIDPILGCGWVRQQEQWNYLQQRQQQQQQQQQVSPVKKGTSTNMVELISKGILQNKMDNNEGRLLSLVIMTKNQTLKFRQ